MIVLCEDCFKPQREYEVYTIRPASPCLICKRVDDSHTGSGSTIKCHAYVSDPRKLSIQQNDDFSVTIEGTRYAPGFFREFGCSFPKMVGQILRIDKKEDGLVTVTRIDVSGDGAGIHG